MSKKLLFNCLFFIFSVSLYSQSIPETLKDWTALEEAEFLVDASYTVVKCSSESAPTVLLNVFNEAGIKTSFGMILHFSDASNTKKDVEINFTNFKQADMRIASCENNQYANLKFNVPDGIDVSSLTLTVTYK